MSLFVHKETEQLHPRTVELMEEVAKRVEQDGIQAWWDLDAADILGAEAADYVKVPDTLDVWFDSGSTHAWWSTCALSSRATAPTCIWKAPTNTAVGSCHR